MPRPVARPPRGVSHWTCAFPRDLEAKDRPEHASKVLAVFSNGTLRISRGKQSPERKTIKSDEDKPQPEARPSRAGPSSGGGARPAKQSCSRTRQRSRRRERSQASAQGPRDDWRLRLRQNPQTIRPGGSQPTRRTTPISPPSPVTFPCGPVPTARKSSGSSPRSATARAPRRAPVPT